MGLFSRKSKTSKANSSSVTVCQSTASLNSSNSKLAGALPPMTPLSPMSPLKLPKVDLPRPPDPQLDPAGYLRSLGAVRERSRLVMDKLLANQLRHFDVDLSKLADVVTFVSGLIKVPFQHRATGHCRRALTASLSQRDYAAPYTSIPAHGRHQHFCVGDKDRIAELLASWPGSVDNTEKCRRLIDLFLVSVLLDAGAGTQWSYKSVKDGRTYRRSEGLAVASLEIFEAVCSSAPARSLASLGLIPI